MVTKPTRGDPNWDVGLNAALDDLQGQITTNGSAISSNNTAMDSRVTTLERVDTFTPADHALIGWNFDPAAATGSTALTAGVLYLHRVILRKAATVTNLIAAVTTSGSTLTAGQNLAGLYDANGNLLASTADQSSAWTSTGIKTMALTVAQALAAGTYYVGLLSNGTTPPTFARGSILSASMVNVGLTVATGRFTTYGTTQTSLPTVTMSSAAFSANAYWVALS